MMDGRTAQRLRQEAWKRLSQEWKDDPEACFAFGFQAGLDAVAPRVEPPVTESGAGFESLPASVHDAWTPDDIAYRPGGLAQPEQGLKNSTEPRSEVGCSKIFKQAQRQWVGLTDEEIDDCMDWDDYSPYAAVRAAEAKLEEKNSSPGQIPS